MDYLGTIRRGFEHIWKNKFLWVLGFLAALGSGSSFSNSNISYTTEDTAALENWLTPERFAALTAGILAFIFIAFVVGIILWIVSLSARGGLIAAVAQLETGQGKPTFSSAFRFGWRRVWRLAGMTILMFAVPAILIAVLVAAFLVPVVGMSVAAGGAEDSSALLAGMGSVAVLFCCLLIVLGLFIFVLRLIYPFAFRGIILRDMGIIDSIRHGWEVLSKNLGSIILLGLAFFLIGIAILILAAAILIPVGLAVGIPLSMLAQSDATLLQGLLAVLGILIGLLIFAAISAITTSWQSSTFTIAYLEWTGKDIAVEG